MKRFADSVSQLNATEITLSVHVCNQRSRDKMNPPRLNELGIIPHFPTITGSLCFIEVVFCLTARLRNRQFAE